MTNAWFDLLKALEKLGPKVIEREKKKGSVKQSEYYYNTIWATDGQW